MHLTWQQYLHSNIDDWSDNNKNQFDIETNNKLRLENPVSDSSLCAWRGSRGPHQQLLHKTEQKFGNHIQL